ncbi:MULTISPECIES: hypothetical protein [Stenotrophomonas]|uniref:hypothetical protein n=1 Tax=Stenotrophomonas sp. yr243 TaxID=1761902 RepID=UPI001FD27258|nr:MULTISPECIES: hypothetical protein [Stenotrophomonas]
MDINYSWMKGAYGARSAFPAPPEISLFANTSHCWKASSRRWIASRRFSARMSGNLQRGIAVFIGVMRRWLRLGLFLDAEQTLDLRQRRQGALLCPALNLLGGELQHFGQLLVGAHAQPGAQRALAHAAIDFRSNPSQWTITGSVPEHIGTKVVTRDPGGSLDGQNMARWHRSITVDPLIDGLRGDPQQASQASLTCSRPLNGDGNRVHLPSLSVALVLSQAMLSYNRQLAHGQSSDA